MRYASRGALLTIMGLVMLFWGVISVWGQSASGIAAAEMLAPEGEEFKVWMPKTPKQVDGKEPYQALTLNSHLYTATSDNGSLFIFVTLSGIKSISNVETERFNSYIDAFGKWLPTKLDGKVAKVQLIYQKEMQLDGHSGREYQLVAGTMSGPVRFFITRKKFYALAVLSAQKKEPLAARFLDSLSLSEKAAESVVSSGGESTRPTKRARAGTGETAASSEGETSAATEPEAGETGAKSEVKTSTVPAGAGAGETGAKSEVKTSTVFVQGAGETGAKQAETADDSPAPAQAQPKAPPDGSGVYDTIHGPNEPEAPCSPQYPKRLPCRTRRSH